MSLVLPSISNSIKFIPVDVSAPCLMSKVFELPVIVDASAPFNPLIWLPAVPLCVMLTVFELPA